MIGNTITQEFVFFRHTRLELVVEPWRAGLWPAFRKVRRPVRVIIFMFSSVYGCVLVCSANLFREVQFRN